MSDKHYPELSKDYDTSIHVQPYADMIDKLTYVQKADFAKRALALERDLATTKAMFEEVGRSRNEWIKECQMLRADNSKLSDELVKVNKILSKVNFAE
jgi:hypothetical protein